MKHQNQTPFIIILFIGYLRRQLIAAWYLQVVNAGLFNKMKWSE